MDRYQKVEKPKPDSPINENEIRITTQGAIRNYITYATSLLQVLHCMLSFDSSSFIFASVCFVPIEILFDVFILVD
jgi:hypothetical protein